MAHKLTNKRKTERIVIRCTRAQKLAIRRAAKRAGRSVSAHVMTAVLAAAANDASGDGDAQRRF